MITVEVKVATARDVDVEYDHASCALYQMQHGKRGTCTALADHVP